MLIAVKNDGIISGSWNVADCVPQKIDVNNLIEVPDGVIVGHRSSLYKEDWTLKSPEELASEGLDEEGEPPLSPEELAAQKAAELAEEAREKAEAQYQSALESAEARFGAKNTADALLRAKIARLQDEIMWAVDQRDEAAHNAVLLHHLGEPGDHFGIASAKQLERYKLKIELARSDSDLYTASERGKIIAAYEAAEAALRPVLVAIDECRRVLAHKAAAVQNDEDLAAVRAAIKALQQHPPSARRGELAQWAAENGGWRSAE